MVGVDPSLVMNKTNTNALYPARCNSSPPVECPSPTEPREPSSPPNVTLSWLTLPGPSPSLKVGIGCLFDVLIRILLIPLDRSCRLGVRIIRGLTTGRKSIVQPNTELSTVRSLVPKCLC